MAEKKTSTQAKSEPAKYEKRSMNYFLNLLSYAAVCIGGIALFIVFILAKFGISTSFTATMQKIANSIGWIVLCMLSFYFIRNRKKIWMWVVWAIAVVMIIVSVLGI